MFPLHDIARRRICLAAFFALGVAPTLAVLAWGVSRQLPTHVHAEAERLSWQSGQKVSLEGVRHLRPGSVRYEGVEISDPETGGRILRCRALEVRRQVSSREKGPARRSLVVIASEPEFEAAQLDELWSLVRGALESRIGPGESDVRLAAAQATLRFGETAQKLTQLQARIERLSGGSQADLTFRLADLETPEPVQIRVARNHQTRPPATGLGIRTGGGLLPSSLLATAIPAFGALGPESRFCGYVWASETPDGWNGELVGQFTGVDLEGLVTRHFPHTLRGTAGLDLQRAVFQKGRLREAAGSLVAGPGAISRSLVDAAADRLGLVCSGAAGPGATGGLSARASGRRADELPVPPRDELLAYDRLAVAFLIDSRGLQIRGMCPPAASGGILAGRYGLLLGEPALQPLPAVSLVQALAPAGAVQVPATHQTDWLLRRLPMPEATAARRADASSTLTQ
jgi:hypothetical protein